MKAITFFPLPAPFDSKVSGSHLCFGGQLPICKTPGVQLLLPFHGLTNSQYFLEQPSSQFWVCATDPSQGAGQPNRRKVQQSHLAVPFSSCFGCNSLFCSAWSRWWLGAPSDGWKSFQQQSPERSPLPSCAVCSDGSRWRRGSGWFQMEKKVEEEKWQMAAEAGSKQEASALCDEHRQELDFFSGCILLSRV